MKNKKFLILYAIIIAIALICILFVIPDEYFLKNKKGYEELKNTVEKIEYEDIETLKKRLLNSEYSYEYNIIHNNKRFVCKGEVTATEENGRCTSPSSFTYTKEDKFNEDKLFNLQYTSPDAIFKKIEGLEYTESMTNDGKAYHYKTKIIDFDTDIIIYTNDETITKINITSGLLSYILKYSNVSY